MATTNTNDKPVLISKLNMEDMDSTTRELIENAYIVYPYTKALFQAVIHCVHNEFEREEISYESLSAIPSQRGDGKLGSSGK